MFGLKGGSAFGVPYGACVYVCTHGVLVTVSPLWCLICLAKSRFRGIGHMVRNTLNKRWWEISWEAFRRVFSPLKRAEKAGTLSFCLWEPLSPWVKNSAAVLGPWWEAAWRQAGGWSMERRRNGKTWFSALSQQGAETARDKLLDKRYPALLQALLSWVFHYLQLKLS